MKRPSKKRKLSTTGIFEAVRNGNAELLQEIIITVSAFRIDIFNGPTLISTANTSGE